jgi:hypothetical protein
MRSARLVLPLVLLGLPFVPVRAVAGDPPAGPSVKPAGPAGAGEAGEPPPDPSVLVGKDGEPPDVLAFVAVLERQVGALKVPPTRTATDHALYDAWHAILAPRAGRMASRIKTLGDKRRWVLSPSGLPLHLEPNQWETVVKELANLYVELDGALTQYNAVRVDYVRPTTMGLTPPEAGPPDPNAPERALARLESQEDALLGKVATGQCIWLDEVLWYYSLLRRAEAEVAKYEADLAHWEAQVQKFEDMRARHDYGLSFKRQTLQMLKFSLRALTAALQVGEEDRLRKVVEPLPAKDATRLAAEALLLDLRTARNSAESHRGASASGWGSLLRSKWMAPRRRLLELLEKAAADAKAKAAADAGGAEGSKAAPK